MTPSLFQLAAACRSLRAGGVIAYPTEAVWGLGCEPFDADACARLLALKQRDWRKGLIVIAADVVQLKPYIGEVSLKQLQPALQSWPGPTTWLVPASTAVPQWVCGLHDRVALRVTAHPVAAALCRAYGGALISTSANIAGRAPARRLTQVRARFGNELDALLTGALGDRKNPTTIRDLGTGKLLRP